MVWGNLAHASKKRYFCEVRRPGIAFIAARAGYQSKMGAIKSLAKDTAVYGLSSIVGRFLNWLLVPLYTITFARAEYGVVTYVYAIVALALVILTYGMETGFFRFANRGDERQAAQVYTTAMTSLAVTSTLFFLLVWAFIGPVTGAMKCQGHPEYVLLMAATVAIDAFSALPFAYLRYRRRPMRFAALRLVSIALNIGLNLFFILLCPWLWEHDPGLIHWFYNPDFGIGYIFLANFISSAVTLLLLVPDVGGRRWAFCPSLLRRMLAYSWPLLIFGVAGIMNQTIGNILLPWLVADKAQAMAQLGVYGANYKIAVVMVMFIQAFRFAYEPFVFARARKDGQAVTAADEEATRRLFADAMKYFVIFSMVIFLAVMAYIDIVRHFIGREYFPGLKVVPVLMVAEFFFGVFFNLSLWYKLTDRTIWGTWLSLIGLAVTVGMCVALVPRIGYMGCAWAALGCYGTMMAVSYAVGRRYYPIDYDVPRLALYFVLALGLYGLMELLRTGVELYDLGTRSLLLAAYIIFACRRERITPSNIIPALAGIVRRKRRT